MKKAKKRVKKLLEELEEKIENVQSSEEFKRLLDYISKFHSYSYRNRILILSQMKNATHVAGYNKWKELDRYVLPKKERKKKGVRVKPIRILAPHFYSKKVAKVDKKDTEEVKEIKEKAENNKTYKLENKKDKLVLKKEKMYFKYVNVYDISQTDGKPVPTLNTDMKDNKHELLKPLKEFTKESNIKIEFNKPSNDERLTKGVEGYSMKGKVVINTENNNLTEQARILIHELAHEFLHSKNERNKEIKEIEADTVSYIVLKHFNIESPTDKYLALYKKDYKISNSLDRIAKTSTKIIKVLEEKLNNNNKKENKKTA